MQTAVRTALMSLVISPLFAASASAQLIKINPPRLLPSLFSWSDDSDQVRDVVIDKSGNRYIVGQVTSGAASDAFLAKFGPLGNRLWEQTFDVGTVDDGRAVAVDANGNPYVAVTVDDIPQIRAYDTSGGFLWSTAFPYHGAINDIAIDSNGAVVCDGNLVSGSTKALFVARFLANNGGLDGGIMWNGAGTFTKILLDANNNMYAAGYVSQSGTTLGDAVGALVTADLSTTTSTAYLFGDGSGNTWNERFMQLAQGPGGMLVMSGYATNVNGNRQGFFGTMYFGDVTVDTDDVGYYDQFAAQFGSTLNDVAVAADGTIYFLGTFGTSTGASVADVFAEQKDPADYWFIDQWADEVGAVDPTKNLTGYGLATLPDSSVALMALDTSLVKQTGSKILYMAYNLFTWAHDGTRLNRRLFGSPAAAIPNAYDADAFAWLGGQVVYDHKHLTAFAPTQGSVGLHGAVWYGTSVVGPDDLYKMVKNTTLSVPQSTGLLSNDANGFILDKVTSKLHGTKPASAAALTVGVGGAFTLTPVTDFTGTITFQYDVYRGGVVVGTHTVKIKVLAS